jgi:hypothetical protein
MLKLRYSVRSKRFNFKKEMVTNSFPVFILRCLLSRTFVLGNERHESPRMVLLLNLIPNETVFDIWKQFPGDNGAVYVCKLDIAISSRLYQIPKKKKKNQFT